jgi:Na+/H+ antiporter NhaD/arsenite permease-like protein
MHDGAVVTPPLWTALPFVGYLLTIAIAPLAFPHFWERNRNKLLLGVIASVPVVFYLGSFHEGAHWLQHALREYVAFIALLGSLFVISGGVHLRGSLAGTPLVNTAFLGAGALLASFIGTTGASMLLIRPLLRANEKREGKGHIVVFFIFIVSNGAGMLTPLGDPPLFLGFLRGVPFLWTLKLIGPWALVNGALLLLFNLVDQRVLEREEKRRPEAVLDSALEVKEPLRVDGAINFLWLAGVIGVIFAMGRYGEALSSNEVTRVPLQVSGMTAMAALSLLTTRRTARAANQFAWAPILEVAAIFLGIFVTMVPALKILESEGAALGVTEPWQYFWATGMLSSFLDNAPTYLTFASLAVGAVNDLDPAAHLTADDLGALAHHPMGAALLIAISCGAVVMGANTYIGNGPNFMVKTIAEASGVRMPSFFRYMVWSAVILLPLFVLVTLVFFRAG